MVRACVLLLLLASCRIYEPEILDCQIRCGSGFQCPRDTLCSDDLFCRPPGITGKCTCSPGQTEACQLSSTMSGICSGGMRTCGEDRVWSNCVGAVVPGIESCNGIDDDCDGVIDGNTIDAPRCALTEGVCSGQHVARCIGGSYATCGDGAYGTDYERFETRCDGLDNDCDGQIDGTPPREVLEGDAFSLSAASMLVRVDGGAQLITFDNALNVIRTTDLGDRFPDAWAEESSARVLAFHEAGGVRFVRFSLDGTRSERVEPTWLGGGPLAVGLEAAAMEVNGEVQVRSLTRNDAPVTIGTSDGGVLTMSATGEWLTWPGGLWRNSTQSHVLTTPLPPMATLFDVGIETVTAVPIEPGGFFYADLANSMNTTPLAVTMRNESASLSGSRIVVAGRTAQGAIWLSTPTSSVQVTTSADAVRVTSGALGVTVGFTRAGKLWLGQVCVP